MAVVTRLGLHGAPAAPFGSFAGKAGAAVSPFDGGVALPTLVFGGGVDAPTLVFGGGVAPPTIVQGTKRQPLSEGGSSTFARALFAGNGVQILPGFSGSSNTCFGHSPHPNG